MTVMNVLILGSGSYVFGEGQNYGTIFPALIEFSKSVNLDITIAIRSSSLINKVRERAEFLMKLCTANGIKSINIVPYLSDKSSLSTYIKSSLFNCCIIALPDHVHYDYCKFSLDHKLPFLVVKPFTLNTDHASSLVQLSSQSCIPGFVEFHKGLTAKQGLLSNRFLMAPWGISFILLLNILNKKNPYCV